MRKIIISVFLIFLISLFITKDNKYNIDRNNTFHIMNFNNEIINNYIDEENIDLYKKYKVNELGRIPIMMYHGITNNKKIDINGYHRTVSQFKNDLEFYYKNNYRMIRLNDYINGVIDVSIGMSPIILTFDDGLNNNFNVLGENSDGNLIIDPNCAVGILEEYKSKYPDFNITATFFLNGGLFGQEEYNEKILKWLIEHGYDIGNHSYNHVDFSKIDSETTIKEIGSLYEKLNNIIGDKYINVVALPFGSPYKKEHNNFKNIISGNYNGFKYNTISTLRVGWESDYSPFSVNFDKTFIKRLRAYDNNGNDFDIEYNFKELENNRYISDGNKDLVVFPKEFKSDFVDNNLEYKEY